MRITRSAAVAAALFTVLGLPAPAQDDGSLSAEEIKNRFEQQTRGLVLAPSTGSTASTAAATTVTETATGETYTQFDADAQINISITFDFDSAALRADQRPKLAAMCEAIKSTDLPGVKIIGHTDSAGSASYNARLSELRAIEVKRYLTDDCGIDENRLQAVGVGEEFPFNKDDPRSDENRRVEFQALS